MISRLRGIQTDFIAAAAQERHAASTPCAPRRVASMGNSSGAKAPGALQLLGPGASAATR